MCALNYWDELYFVLVSGGTPRWTVHLSFFTFYILHCCYPHYQCFSSPPSFDVFSNNKFAWQLVNAEARLYQVRNTRYVVSTFGRIWALAFIVNPSELTFVSVLKNIVFGWSTDPNQCHHHLHQCLGCTSQSVQCEANGSLCSRLLAHFLPSVSTIVYPTQCIQPSVSSHFPALQPIGWNTSAL